MRVGFFTVMLMVAVMSGILAADAMAQQQGCGNVSFTLTPDSGVAGSSVSVSGSGALSMDNYTLYWDSTSGTVLATDSADGSGHFSTTITIPAGATVGSHNVIFSGADSQESSVECPQPFTVIAATAEEGVQPDAYVQVTTLPSTGLMVIVPAAGLLLSGAALVAWRRRS